MSSYSVTTKKLKGGEKRYKVDVKQKQGKEIVFRKTKTFKNESDAIKHGEELTRKLDSNLGHKISDKEYTIKKLIDLRIHHDGTKGKKWLLDNLSKTQFANIPINKITENEIIDFFSQVYYANTKQNEIIYLESSLTFESVNIF